MSVLEFIKSNGVVLGAAILVFALLGGLFGFVRGSGSVAEATILLQNPDSIAVFEPLRPGADRNSEVFINNQLAVLVSTEFAGKVASDLGLGDTPAAAEEVLDRMSAASVANSFLIEVRFEGDTPEAAALGVATIVDIYSSEVDDAVSGPYDDAIDALDSALANTTREISVVQAELSALQIEATSTISASIQEIIDQIQALIAQIPQASAEQQQTISAEINALATQANLLQIHLANQATNPAATALTAELSDAVAEKSKLMNRRVELTVQQAGTPSLVAVTSVPLAGDILPPSIPMSVLTGSLIGLLIGLGYATWTDADGHRRFSAPHEPREPLQSQLLAEIPNHPAHGTLRVLEDPESDEARIFTGLDKLIRAYLITAQSDGVVAVAACGKGPTKSRASVNLALSAMQAGVNTLLIDADVEDPTTTLIIGNRVGTQIKLGLSDVLRGDFRSTEVMRTFTFEDHKLDFIGAGFKKVSGIQTDGQLATLLKALQRQHSFIVIDLPSSLNGPIVRQLRDSNTNCVVVVEHGAREAEAHRLRDTLDALGMHQLGYLYSSRRSIIHWFKRRSTLENAHV